MHTLTTTSLGGLGMRLIVISLKPINPPHTVTPLQAISLITPRHWKTYTHHTQYPKPVSRSQFLLFA